MEFVKKMTDAIEELRTGKTVRPLGVQERLLFLYSKEHHRHFCVVGEISGSFGFAELRAAVLKAQRRHPQLWYAVQDDVGGPRFIEHDAPVQIEFCSLAGDASWQRIVEVELAKPFRPWIGPLLRTTINQDPSETNRISIVLTFHHAIADGLSGVAFLKDIVSALRGDELPAAVRNPAVEDLLRRGQPDQDQAPVRPILDRETIEQVTRQPLWRPFAGDRPQVSSALLDRDVTDALVSNSRENGTTVHGALCAALTMANARRHRHENYSILSPINLRPVAAIDASEVGLFVTVALTRQTLSRAIKFWALAKAYSQALVEPRSKEHLIRAMRGLESTLPPTATADIASALIGSRGYDAVISNLGVVGSSASGDGPTLKAVWGPMVLGRIRNERMVGAATFDGSLRLTEARPFHIPESLVQTVALLKEAAR